MQQQPSPPQWQGQGGQQQQQQVVFMAAQPNPGVVHSAANSGAVSYYPQGVPQVVVVSVPSYVANSDSHCTWQQVPIDMIKPLWEVVVITMPLW